MKVETLKKDPQFITAEIQNALKGTSPFVLLETNRKSQENQTSHLFTSPIKILSCYSLSEVYTTLLECESELKKGNYLAGFISFEAGYAFEKFKKTPKSYSFPLIWFGIFSEPVSWDNSQPINLSTQNFYKVEEGKFNLSFKEYSENLKAIKELICAGDTYQVNHTFKYQFRFDGDPFSWYQDLKKRQKVSYAAFIRGDDFTSLSLSPELFFRKKGSAISVRPMKGTLPRGMNSSEDTRLEEELKNDPKMQAENLMIVDLLRNDLGRISETGSVVSQKLFQVEKYETLHQMTSSIQASLKKNLSLTQLFQAIFPSGSVTGAPKIRTMEIIQSLEKEPRGIYTGGIGFIAPNGDAVFNVGIRTVSVLGNKGEMGVGSGIIFDSDPKSEFEECKLKTKFLREASDSFQLIETLLWSSDSRFFLLKEHINRLKKSAKHFGFRFYEKELKIALQSLEEDFNKKNSYKVRVLLSQDGNFELTFERISKRKKQKVEKVCLSEKRTDSKSFFYQHKTTERALYDVEYLKAKEKGFVDILFQNENGNLTEGAISNLFIQKGDRYFTPPLQDGVLPGVYREYFMQLHSGAVYEKSLTLKDLEAADAIFLTNSVQGCTPVTFSY